MYSNYDVVAVATQKAMQINTEHHLGNLQHVKRIPLIRLGEMTPS